MPHIMASLSQLFGILFIEEIELGKIIAAT